MKKGDTIKRIKKRHPYLNKGFVHSIQPLINYSRSSNSKRKTILGCTFSETSRPLEARAYLVEPISQFTHVRTLLTERITIKIEEDEI